MATMPEPPPDALPCLEMDIAAHCLELAGSSEGDGAVTTRQLMRLVRSSLVTHLELTGHQGHLLAKLPPSATFRSCTRLTFSAAATQQELAGIVRGVHHAVMYWTDLQHLELCELPGNGEPLSGAVFWGAVLLSLRGLPHLKELTARGLDAASLACLALLTQLTQLELQLATQAAPSTRSSSPSAAGAAEITSAGGTASEPTLGRRPSMEASRLSLDQQRPRTSMEATRLSLEQQRPRSSMEATRGSLEQQRQQHQQHHEEEAHVWQPPAADARQPAVAWDLSALRRLTRLQVLVLCHDDEANPADPACTVIDASSTWSTTASGTCGGTCSSAGGTSSSVVSVSSRASHASSYIMESLRQLSFKTSRLSPGSLNAGGGAQALGSGCLPPSLQQLVIKGRCSMSSWALHMMGCAALRSLHLTDATGHIAEQHLTAEGYPALLQALATHAPRLNDLHIEGHRLPASSPLARLTELTRLWLSPLPCQREQDWEVLAALPRLRSLGLVVLRTQPPGGAQLTAVTELQVRVTATLSPRALSLALMAFPVVEHLALHDLNQLLLPGAWEPDAGVPIAPVPSITSVQFNFPMAPGVTGKRAAAVLSLLPSLQHLHLQGYFAEDCIPFLGGTDSALAEYEEGMDSSGGFLSDSSSTLSSQLTCLVVDMQRAFNPGALLERLQGGDALEVLQLPAGEGLSIEQKEEVALALGRQLPALRLLRWPLPAGETEHLQGLLPERVRLEGSGSQQQQQQQQVPGSS